MTRKGWEPDGERPNETSRGAPLERIGRAERIVCGEVELWSLPAEDERVARRLLTLGASNVGGFAFGGADARGVWLVRTVPARTMEALGRNEKIAWRVALASMRDVARGLEACERAGLFPGPLRPSEIAYCAPPTLEGGLDGSGEDARAWLLADRLIGAMVGAKADGRTSTAPSPKWTPPEQAAGASWDNAANRYVLGLITYRAIAGAHPFGGAGLRHALSEQGGDAPPFDDEIARAMVPGVQSFILKLLNAAMASRPPDAASIARRAEELLEGRESVVPAEPPRVTTKLLARPRHAAPATAAPRPQARRRAWIYAVPAAGLLASGIAFLAGAPSADAPAKATPVVHARAALATTTAADCAPCHARHVAEWERSVMAHAAKSPLFGALESVVEEQVGKDERCPNGAGILRKAGGDTCREEQTGITVTGSGGEHWCVNCHSPGENLRASMPAWSANGDKKARAPVRDLLSAASMEGISCAGCHETIGPVAAHGARAGRGQGRDSYEGNPTWISTITGQTFRARPEDSEGRTGIGNSGYLLDPSIFLGSSAAEPGEPIVHRRSPRTTAAYLKTSEFCGSCHDVRLFGSDVINGRDRGEHFKRLRNGYSEWKAWSDLEKASGRTAATCQGCHMSLYPGVCASGGAGGPGCPSGSHFEPRPAGDFANLPSASTSREAGHATQHYFTSVDVPLADSFPDAFLDDATLDAAGIPVGLRNRRELLLRHTFRFELGNTRVSGGQIEIPLRLTNTGAGHRVPAGFSQEREIWVELTVKDARGAVVYEVGKLPNEGADLRDKVFLRVNTSDVLLDGRGRPQGLFGADVIDGPDVPAWIPNPSRGGTTFRGRGLVNLQNGFLRCVRCIGTIDQDGQCQPGEGQGRTRADRFADGAYDIDTGECRSNLSGGNELFETYFPVGALDADRGLCKAPDAIIDTRSAAPGVELTYTYLLDAGTHPPPYDVEARLRFRAFPPYLVRAFAAYEANKAAQGLRPSGPQVSERMIKRLESIELASVRTRVK